MTYINIYSLYINTSEVPDWHCAGAEQGTDNSGTVIHFRFPAGPRPAGAVSGEGPGGKGICLDAKYLRGKSSPTYMDKGRFVRANNRTYLKCFADGHCSTANNCSDSMIYQLDLSGIMISWRAFI